MFLNKLLNNDSYRSFQHRKITFSAFLELNHHLIFLFIKTNADAKDTQLTMFVLIISEPKIMMYIYNGSEEKLKIKLLHALFVV